MKWWLLAGGIFLVLLVLQHFIWTGMTVDLQQSIDSIMKLAHQ